MDYQPTAAELTNKLRSIFDMMDTNPLQAKEDLKDAIFDAEILAGNLI